MSNIYIYIYTVVLIYDRIGHQLKYFSIGFVYEYFVQNVSEVLNCLNSFT